MVTEWSVGAVLRHSFTLTLPALRASFPLPVAEERARDAQGRVMLLRRHGTHFASRLLDNHLNVRLDRQLLTVGTGEKRFGTITLDLGDQAPAWAASLRRL